MTDITVSYFLIKSAISRINLWLEFFDLLSLVTATLICMQVNILYFDSSN